jgi:membrane-associated phospholipid phosphatase
MRATALMLAMVTVTAAGGASAEPPPPLAHDPLIDGMITGTGAVLWITSDTIFKHALAPTDCKWCDRNADGTDSVNGLDRSVREKLRWTNTARADLLSNVGIGLGTVVAIGGTALAANHDGARANIGSDALVISEALVLAQDLNQAVKLTVGRERPFVHDLAPAEKQLTANPTDNNLSFFSGHTTFAFTMATAAGTVCSMHGYSFAPYVWAGGLTVASGTALLRIGADKHYATDVLTGALIGTVFGIGVPRLFHRPRTTTTTTAGQASLELQVQPLSTGAGLSISGQL